MDYYDRHKMTSDSTNPLHYFTEITSNRFLNKDIKFGDLIEMEVVIEMDQTNLDGRSRYYGTPFLYRVGTGGTIPWEARGTVGDTATEAGNSFPLPEESWLGGKTTQHEQASDEPTNVFMQMAANASPQNGQPFMRGRRVSHTNFTTGAHDEPENPIWTKQMGKAGPNFVNTSCVSCHFNNGRSIPPAVGSTLSKYVFKIGDANGNAIPQLGSVLQPQNTSSNSEGTVTLSGWTATTNGLQKPDNLKWVVLVGKRVNLHGSTTT